MCTASRSLDSHRAHLDVCAGHGVGERLEHWAYPPRVVPCNGTLSDRKAAVSSPPREATKALLAHAAVSGSCRAGWHSIQACLLLFQIAGLMMAPSPLQDQLGLLLHRQRPRADRACCRRTVLRLAQTDPLAAECLLRVTLVSWLKPAAVPPPHKSKGCFQAEFSSPSFFRFSDLFL